MSTNDTADERGGAANGPNSDTMVDENPYKVIKPNSGEFYARAVITKWNDALGSTDFILRTNSHKDTRRVTVHRGEPLYSAIVTHTPLLPEYPEYLKDRALYPVMKVCLDHQQHVTSFEAMPLSDEEKHQKETQRIFDELHQVGRANGVAYGTVDRLARECQQLYTEDWPTQAERNIVAYGGQEKSRRVIEAIRLHKNQFDYWWKGDTNEYPFDFQYTSDLDAYFGPKEKPVSDAPMTLEDYFKDDKVRKNFWTSARNICKSNGIEDSKLQDEHIHEVLVGGTGASVKDFQGNAGEALKIIVASFDTKSKHTQQPAENSAKEADLAPSSDTAPTTQQKQNTHQEGEMSNSEQTIVSRDEKVKEIREKFNKPQRGNDYLTVQGRIALFRLKNPSGSIDTEHVILTEDTAVFRAKIVIDGAIVASGYGRATEAGTKNLGGRYVEKAETAAIGRALAVAGYGTDDSLDDADYLSDSPIERKAA